jgi:hypothetical protein
MVQHIISGAFRDLGMHIHSHLFRHTVATHLNRIAGIEVTQHALGHKRMENTKRYILAVIARREFTVRTIAAALACVAYFVSSFRGRFGRRRWCRLRSRVCCWWQCRVRVTDTVGSKGGYRRYVRRLSIKMIFRVSMP